MVERLYGVSHSARQLGLEGRVLPSRELLEYLGGLPSESRVGIETCEEFYQKGAEEARRLFTEGSLHYWDQVVEFCEALNLEPVFLDNFGLLIAHRGKLRESLQNLDAILEIHPEWDGYQQTAFQWVETDEHDRSLIRAFWSALAESQYIFTVAREDRIIENLKQYNLRVAIIGRDHSDLLILSPDRIAHLGVNIGQYLVEALREDTLSLAFQRETALLISRTLTGYEPDSHVFLARELIERQHRAVKRGRILDGQHPDFIGTWNTNCPAAGLFEVYLKGSGFSGVIEDVLGTAMFEGEITDGSVVLRKNYVTRLHPRAAEGEIVFKGETRDGRYEGVFTVASRASGRFVLNPGTKF